MSSRARRSLLTAFVVLAVAGVLERAREANQLRHELEPTSFGTTANGFGALYDLLIELRLPVERTYARPAELPAGATVWWIEPADICADAAESPDARDQTLRTWIAAGGTMVLFLSPERCSAVAGISLPATEARGQATAQPADADHSAHSASQDEASVMQLVTGPLVRDRRLVTTSGMSVFAEPADWRVMASIHGQPFVIVRALGNGRLVVVADAAFLRNAFLDSGDAAPLALDLVRAYGVPLLDERGHGLRAYESAIAYLARSPACPLFAGFIVLALLVGWRGSAVPPLTTRTAAVGAPTLDAFVDSLATLYARTHDYARVLDRYRELTADRLRRHLGLPPETTVASIAARLRHRPGVAAAALHTLVDGAAVRNEQDLRTETRRLDELAQSQHVRRLRSPRGSSSAPSA